MSSEKELQQERRDSSLTGGEEGGTMSLWPVPNSDADSTPRSELPPQSLHIRRPAKDEDILTTAGVVSDYFALPTLVEKQAISDVVAPSLVSATGSNASSSTVSNHGHAEQLANSTSTSADLRPLPQTQISSLSVESTESNSTVLAPSAQNYPVYPNQSYAALHHQHHPRPHIPPLHRPRSAHSGNILNFTSALASTHQTGARTTNNSPALGSNTGLFEPRSALEPGSFEPAGDQGTYSSPFLHFTHRQVPKETHVADVDVDTMSGRKVINHYEVIDELGRGTHGKVKLGRDLDTPDTFVAIKIVERYSKRRKLGKLGQPEDKVKKEVAILKKARHPNIVALLEVIDDPKRKKVYIVLELVERGEILWRIKSLHKEVALLEARRYERERSGRDDHFADAEDGAITAEANRRLARKTRHAMRKYRQNQKNAPEDTMVFSHETVGDYESGDDDDDNLSRISTATADSQSKKPQLVESRLPSRPPTPMMIALDSRTPSPATPQFLPLTAESDTDLDRHLRQPSNRFYTGLEGTMYGAYDVNGQEISRPCSANAGRQSTEELVRLANEVLDSELNPELEYVPVMTFQQARAAFRDTLLGLQYLHSQGIVHRDIKPPNLLSTRDHRVKISDFGVSYLGRPVPDGDVPEDVSEHEAEELNEARELAKTVGTPAFYAPELCITEGSEDPYPVTKAIDVWALGVTLFCMIFARTPFVDQEFVVMRQIADEDIYIPRKRLVPAVIKASSRPPSHRRGAPEQSLFGRRGHGEIAYEPIDDDLYDLLQRLLTKDPRKRMTLDEARRHPWVFADLADKKNQWLAENDPSQPSQIKKIEVSNEDVNTAVVPIQFMDRVRSSIKKVGERLGLSGGRARGLSNASQGQGISPSVSANSSSSNISQDARRHSLRGDESIFSALQKSCEVEHPLARSVAASPDAVRRDKYFDVASIPSIDEQSQQEDLFRVRSRPPMDRSKTTMSTAGSVRTLKASEHHAGPQESSPPSPGLPGTPMALDTPSAGGLSAFFGNGPARRVLKTLRERRSMQSPGLRDSSVDRSSVDSFDPHSEPSLAVSNTSVAGHVNPPEALQELDDLAGIPDSVQNSPRTRPDSAAGSSYGVARPGYARDGRLSRQSSASSILSDLVRSPVTHVLGRNAAQMTPMSRLAGESTDEEWQHGKSELIRRLILEGADSAESGPYPSVPSDQECPPSPDDLDLEQLADDPGPRRHEGLETRVVASSSSDFGSAISMSVSNPSMPSALSANSSFDPIDTMSEDGGREKRQDSSDGTLQSPRGTYESVDEGYRPDMSSAFNSSDDDDDDDDDFDDSSDSDGGLVMTRRRSKQGNSSIPANGTGLYAGGGRRGTGASARSKKTSRSGSNNTMKKVRTHDS